MARAPAHKFGQIIGNVLEGAIEPLLRQFAQRHSLYLDRVGARPARKGKKVAWTDLFGNTHDLDYVLERGGTAEKIGTPVAFIETAWRRYTKHSRNKAQEIQGAILPLVTTHRNAAPFIGVVLAGVFTDGALDQLRSRGFSILYFPYDIVVEAFRSIGIDASYEETTPDAELERKVRIWEELSENQRLHVAQRLVEINSTEVQRFMQALERAATRQIESVRVLPLHGRAVEWGTIEEAITFIESYDEDGDSKPVAKYEVGVRYNNGDRIEGQFTDRESAIDFLRSYLPSVLRPA
jgi:hypothetical protein